SGVPIMCIGVQHIMDNQDPYGRKHKTTGGNKMLFMASGCMILSKTELSSDDADMEEIREHYKTLDESMSAEARKKLGKKRLVGITSKMEILKSRVSKPFEKIDIQ